MILVGAVMLIMAEEGTQMRLVFALIGFLSSLEGVVLFVYGTHLLLTEKRGL